MGQSNVQNISLLRSKLDENSEFLIDSSTIDQAFMFAVLEHLSFPKETLLEINRVLKNGGSLYLTTPTPSSKPILEFLAYKLRLIDEAEIRDHKHYFSKKELIEFCQEKIGKYKVPKEFIFVEDIPKTHVGKIDKSHLQKTYENLVG